MTMTKFYDNSRNVRKRIIDDIHNRILDDLTRSSREHIIIHASENDTHIRKNVYLAIGRIYREKKELRTVILQTLDDLLHHVTASVRQTTVYALGEIGKIDFNSIVSLLNRSLHDEHHSVRNAVVGSLKQLGRKDHVRTLAFAREHLHHEDPVVRRAMIHGIELHGRSHPGEVLPILHELQNDPSKTVRKMVVHVLGQISYKEGCLEKVISHLKNWNNMSLVDMALREIVKVHRTYDRFSEHDAETALSYIRTIFPNNNLT